MTRYASLALCAALWLGSVGLAAPQQGQMARIDIYVADEAFDLTDVGASSGTQVGRCSWLGEGKALTGVSCQKRLGREWERIWVEFVAEADGQVDIDLQGEYYEKETDDDVRLVLADDVTVEGAAIRNPGFEEAGADGGPAGWRFTGHLPAERYSRDGSASHHGRSCVAVWYGAQARQAFAVRAGQRYRVAAWFRVVDPAAVWTPPSYRFEVAMETYDQELTLEFDSPESARLAEVSVAPLLGGARWSVSCRWDDNSRDDLKMRDVMTAHGHKGTFYLNDPGQGFGEVARQLLEGGHTIGGHAMTHPFLSYTNANRQFWEVAAVRQRWEAAVDLPVNSYSFSFCDFRSGPDGAPAQRDIAASLHRAGYFHIANGWFNNSLDTDFDLSPILPSDGLPIRDAAEGFLNDEGHRERHPHMSHSMHVWYRTPEAWEKFEAQLDAYGGREDWWYPNENEYAAYRRQFRETALDVSEPEGNVRKVSLRRPVLRELNDAVPLTFVVTGVDAESLTGVSCGTADVALVRTPDGAAAADVSHDRSQSLPEAIDLIENDDNRTVRGAADVSDKFPGVSALLHAADSGLWLDIVTDGEPLKDVHVTYRLPPGRQEGREAASRRRFSTVETAVRTVLNPTPATDDYRYLAGRAFYAAQIDFRRGGRVGRLHLSCRAPVAPRDESFPQGGFLRAGPLPAVPPEPTLPGMSVEWSREPAEAIEMLSPEVIATSGQWHNPKQEEQVYLLHSTVTAPEPMQATLLGARQNLRTAFVNGVQVGDGPFELEAGANDLVVVAIVTKERFGALNAGCFLRLTKPGTRERLTGIRFGVPEDEGP